ncbi:MAG: hypothetical protein V7700_03650 [Halioglobus sp.]
MLFCTRFSLAMMAVAVTVFLASAQSSSTGTDADSVHDTVPQFTISTVAGIGKRGMSGDGGPAMEAELGGPAEKAQTSNPDIIAFGPNGNLFIPDHLNAVVRKLTRAEK